MSAVAYNIANIHFDILLTVLGREIVWSKFIVKLYQFVLSIGGDIRLSDCIRINKLFTFFQIVDQTKARKYKHPYIC